MIFAVFPLFILSTFRGRTIQRLNMLRHREEILRKKAEKYAATKVSKRVPRFTTIEEYRKYNSDRHKMYYARRKARKAEQEATVQKYG